MCTFKKVIYKCLKCLGCDFSAFLNSKSERIKVQKYSYLIEKLFGFSIGTFRLYLNGPYNTKLTEAIYDIAEHEQDYQNSGPETLQPSAISIFAQLRDIFNVEGSTISEVELLELYTTYDYIRNNISFTDDTDIFGRLKTEKIHIFNRHNDVDIINILTGIDGQINNIQPACS